MKISEKMFKEPRFLALLSVALLSAINSIFFIAREVEELNLFAFAKSNNIYFAYVMIGLLFLGLIFNFYKNSKNRWSALIKNALWVFFPTIIIWLFGFSYSIHFNYTFKIVTGLYFILAIGFFLIKARGFNDVENFLAELRKKTSFPDLVPLDKKWLAFFLILIISLNVGFGTFHLTKFAAVDEALWTQDRIPKFWNNVLEREFHKTKVSDKPGITVAIISGTGLLSINPKDYKNIKYQSGALGSQKSPEKFNFAFRFPIFIFTSLSLLFFFFLFRALAGTLPALIAITLIGLSPILLGISTIINPDSLLWIFVPLSLISYFVYFKEQSSRYLYLSGILLGLSILTKYVANILYVFYFGLIFLQYILEEEKFKNISINEYLRKAFIDYATLVFFSLLTFFVLLPKNWVSPSTLLESTLFSQAFLQVWPIFVSILTLISFDIIFLKSKCLSFILNFLSKYRTVFVQSICGLFFAFILLTLLNTYSGMRWFDIEAILASPKTAYLNSGMLGMMTANFYSLIFGINPLALFFLAGTSLYLTLSKRPFFLKNYAVYLILFILFYYFASSVEKVSATVRYQIILYPIALLVSAIGISQMLLSLKNQKFVLKISALGGLIALSIISLILIKPFYFSYASPLLPKQYVLNLKDMGDGSYEAAQYLNALPQSKNLIIWTDKRGVCMFFVGECRSGVGFEKDKITFDYFVVSAGRENRTTKMILSRVGGGNNDLIRLDKFYDEPNPQFKIEIGNRANNFIKIIKADNEK